MFHIKARRTLGTRINAKYFFMFLNDYATHVNAAA
jgi:hypothetical protein